MPDLSKKITANVHTYFSLSLLETPMNKSNLLLAFSLSSVMQKNIDFGDMTFTSSFSDIYQFENGTIAISMHKKNADKQKLSPTTIGQIAREQQVGQFNSRAAVQINYCAWLQKFPNRVVCEPARNHRSPRQKHSPFGYQDLVISYAAFAFTLAAIFSSE